MSLWLSMLHRAFTKSVNIRWAFVYVDILEEEAVEEIEHVYECNYFRLFLSDFTILRIVDERSKYNIEMRILGGFYQ